MLSENVKVSQIEEGQSAGTSPITSDAVDMAGFEGVLLIGSYGVANSGNYAKVQQSDDDGVSDGYSDLENTKTTPTVSGNTFMIDIYRPQKRYLKVVETIGSSSAVGPMLAIQYGPKVLPPTHGSTVDDEAHISPDEGTA